MRKKISLLRIQPHVLNLILKRTLVHHLVLLWTSPARHKFLNFKFFIVVHCMYCSFAVADLHCQHFGPPSSRSNFPDCHAFFSGKIGQIIASPTGKSQIRTCFEFCVNSLAGVMLTRGCPAQISMCSRCMTASRVMNCSCMKPWVSQMRARLQNYSGMENGSAIRKVARCTRWQTNGWWNASGGLESKGHPIGATGNALSDLCNVISLSFQRGPCTGSRYPPVCSILADPPSPGQV